MAFYFERLLYKLPLAPFRTDTRLPYTHTPVLKSPHLLRSKKMEPPSKGKAPLFYLTMYGNVCVYSARSV